MLSYIARIVGQYVLVLFLAVTLNFMLPRLAPGSVLMFVVPPAQAGSLTAQQRQEILAEYGLAEPLPHQFVNYLVGIPQGEFGYSVIYGRPVFDLLFERLPWTLLLVGTALLLSVWIGTVLGFRSGWRRGRARDVGTLSGVMLLDSMPPFFVGLLLVLTFSVHLGLFPVYGAIPAVPASGLEVFAEVGQRLVLPVVTLTVVSVGSIYMVARPAMVSESQEDYVLMAEAKGLDKRGIRRHARRNALVPVTTVTMISVGDIVGGAIVIETIFSYPGLGRLIYESVLARDYPVLQGAFLMLAITVVLANLASDLLYPRIDPRIRPSHAGAR